ALMCLRNCAETRHHAAGSSSFTGVKQPDTTTAPLECRQRREGTSRLSMFCFQSLSGSSRGRSWISRSTADRAEVPSPLWISGWPCTLYSNEIIGFVLCTCFVETVRSDMLKRRTVISPYTAIRLHLYTGVPFCSGDILPRPGKIFF